MMCAQISEIVYMYILLNGAETDCSQMVKLVVITFCSNCTKKVHLFLGPPSLHSAATFYHFVMCHANNVLS